MQASTTPDSTAPANTSLQETTVPALVGEIYESAPPGLRARMIEHLLQPLGVLALVAIANGIFARIRFRAGWPQINVRLEDVAQVQPSDVVVLADRAQQMSVDVIDGLARLVTSSPVIAGSAATVLLLAALMQRQKIPLHND